jgi:hypothetical protein
VPTVLLCLDVYNAGSLVFHPGQRERSSLVTPLRFVPYAEAADLPNIVVDGAAAAATVLTLSHWPQSGTPATLRADTSAEIVFNYLDVPATHVEVAAASNNHFDEDGLIGIFALTRPELAARWRALLVEIARAGDFGVCRSRNAARIAFVLAAYAEKSSSPLPRSTFAGPYAEVTARLYEELLPIVPHLVTHVEDFQKLWAAEDRALEESQWLLDGGIVTIEPNPDVDLAIVRVPADSVEPHAMALHTRTPYSRLIVVHGTSVELRYRYESWVQFASRRIAPRVDLAPLATELNALDPGAAWTFEGVEQITPRLYRQAPGATLPVDRVIERMIESLRIGPAAWNPYGSENQP